MTPNEIMHAAKRDQWSGMGELIKAARRVHGAEWTRAFTACENCGRLVIDPAAFDGTDSCWHEVQVGRGSMAGDGTPTGLPPVDLVCAECLPARMDDARRVAKDEADESWRRQRRAMVR